MKYHIFILFFLLFIITSCDAYNTISYKVSNKTNKEITIIDIKKYRACGLMLGNRNLNDTVVVPSNSESVIFKCKHIGPKRYAKDLVKDQIPLDSILIIYPNGTKKLTSKLDLSSWVQNGSTATLIID